MNNPTRIAFSCPDHDFCTGHEIDFVNQSTSEVDTLQVGRGTVIDGEVVIDINVQPRKFGQYVNRVRALVGTLESDDSVPSDVWQRVPGAPGKPTLSAV